jgi:hypothetical protein
MKMEHTECSETSAYKIQTPGNYPEENILQIAVSFILRRSVVCRNFISHYEVSVPNSVEIY